MNLARKKITFRWLYKKVTWTTFICGALIVAVRFSKGAGFLDVFAILTKPFFSGSAQKEWIQYGDHLEKEIRIELLEADNYRLRKLLELKAISKDDRISAAVISRSSKGWWQQLIINKGANDGIANGDSVVGPGGLVGIVNGLTPFTSKVRLLTAPGSRLGVWISRTENHGMLIGIGTNRPKLTFLNKDTEAKVGDIVTTSPASSLLPPNLVVGVIQHIEKRALPTPYAIVQLIAAPEAIDWVQVLEN